ncbi:efflux transporter outer membrane subunit [Pseudomonas sp. F1_0610]|uniref:efflux transporter outer membrane subunit n=1 Tax=Pseudomonas sp. F1_0610 TaxID=3114284 RepID=UPI0039C276D4
MIRKWVSASSLSLLLVGCANVGMELPETTALPEQWQQTEFINADFLELEWWREFDDPLLNQLQGQMLAKNLDLQLSAQRLLQAYDLLQVQRAAQRPELGAESSYQRQRDALKAEDQAWSNRTQVGFSSVWAIDLWGQLRHRTEAAKAQAAMTLEQQHALQIALMAELASAYVDYRATQQLILVTRQNQAAAEQNLSLTQKREELGVATRLEVEQANSQLKITVADLPLLEEQAHRLINAMSLLLNQTPNTLTAQLSEATEVPMIKRSIATGVPSELAQRRPDIRMAEQHLRQTTAMINAAKADFYPSIRLTGNIGLDALHTSDLSNWSSRAFSFGPSLYLPIFTGGRLTSQLRLTEHKQQEAAIAYQKTVLTAWHEIDNQLMALKTQDQHVNNVQDAVQSAQLAAHIAREQYEYGESDFINVLDSQSQLLRLQLQAVKAQQSKARNQIQLFQALGGGWGDY